jgi:hypothetical protein
MIMIYSVFEVGTGSREENASKQRIEPSVLMLSEPKALPVFPGKACRFCGPDAVDLGAAIGDVAATNRFWVGV